jgi:hypothetical protein
MIIDPGQERYVAAMDAVLASSLTLLASWEDQYRDADERLPWVEGGAIARFMAQMVQDDPHSPELQSVCDAIEAAFASDVDDGFLQIALIEALQNVTSNRHIAGEITVTAADVKAHLGPLSQASWEALNESWGNSVDNL